MLATVEETKIKALALRVTRQERAALELEAGRLGVSLSDYTRQAIRAYTSLTRGALSMSSPHRSYKKRARPQWGNTEGGGQRTSRGRMFVFTPLSLIAIRGLSSLGLSCIGWGKRAAL